MIELPEHLKPQVDEVVSEPVEMIELPEHLKPQADERVAHDLGSAALNDGDGGRFNNGSIPLSFDQVGPQAIRQNGTLVAPDTYVIPTMKNEREG